MADFTNMSIDDGARDSPQDSKDKLIDAMSRLDGLVYVAPFRFSSIVKKSYITIPTSGSNVFQPGSEMSFNMNTGENYLGGPESALKFTLVITGESMDLGKGTGVNFMESVILTHSTGTQITHNLQRNNYEYINQGYDAAADWHRTSKTVMRTGVLPVGSHDVIIPLKYINGSFDSKRMMPWQVASNMRIQLGLASLGKPGKSAGSLARWTIQNPEILVAAHMLSDVILSRLNNIAASKDGLIYTFNDYVHTSTGSSTGNTLLESKRKLAVANLITTQSRITANVELATADSFVSEPSATSFSSWFYNYGGQQLPVSSRSVVGVVEKYYMALQAYHRYNETVDNTSISLQTFTDTDEIAAINLQRSGNSMSGLPLELGRTVSFSGVFTDNTLQRTVDMFVSHVVMINVLGQRIVVKN
jgi:hypothetical protein